MLEASLSCVEAQDKDTGKLTVDNAILGIFLQVGGMSFEYDPNAAKGNKVKAVYLDGESKKGRTDTNGLLKITVPDGPHSVSLDKKTEVYINNYSGIGVDVTIDFPQLI